MIPHTLAETTLAERVPGDRVNLEADVLLKHIEALLRRARPASPDQEKSDQEAEGMKPPPPQDVWECFACWRYCCGTSFQTLVKCTTP